jgi:ribosome-binding factor A
VNESIREVLSAEIAAGLKDPRIGFVTVTGVEATPDLRHAKVYVSVLGGERERRETLAGLEASRGYLQGRVAEDVHMKRTPQLTFIYDETTDRAMRIERLIKKEAEELGETPPQPSDEEAAEEAETTARPQGEAVAGAERPGDGTEDDGGDA